MLSRLSPQSHVSYVLFAWVAMAGLAYINFLPAVVNALAGSIGFTGSEAGQIIALNGYGALAGSTIAIFVVRRIQWRGALLGFLLVLAALDVATVWIIDMHVMLAWRFIAGVLGGLSVGIAFSVLARLNKRDRAFGLLLFIQFGLGSLVIYLLPGLERQFGGYAAFYVMASISLLSLFVLAFLPNVQSDPVPAHLDQSVSKSVGISLRTLLAMFSYQLAASAIWAYAGLIGSGAGLSKDSISVSIALTGLLGLLGAMLPIVGGNDPGRFKYLRGGIAISMLSAMLLNYADTTLFYVASLALLFLSWPAVQSYLLAQVAEMDSSGQLSTVAALISYGGLASGPLLASQLMNPEDFSVLLFSCAALFLLSGFLTIARFGKPERAMVEGSPS
ncbi:MFS transporter [Pseudoteredinibacter isoporae]|uniref:MFS transporter n=1 Tax=Pseudoteredinibacter isoporae TaxID=570281 RepID=UPI0031067B7C